MWHQWTEQFSIGRGNKLEDLCVKQLLSPMFRAPATSLHHSLYKQYMIEGRGTNLCFFIVPGLLTPSCQQVLQPEQTCHTSHCLLHKANNDIWQISNQTSTSIYDQILYDNVRMADTNLAFAFSPLLGRWCKHYLPHQHCKRERRFERDTANIKPYKKKLIRLTSFQFLITLYESVIQTVQNTINRMSVNNSHSNELQYLNFNLNITPK